MRKDQSGFTLVEMLIAVTIMAIVIAAVCSFIIVGSKSYASGNSDISVQQEAQLALNQISDVLIDTTRSVNYAAYDASGSATLGLKDAEFAFEPSGKSLTMLNGVSVVDPGGSETIEEGNGNKNYLFYWDKADETLYYSEIGITETTFPLPGESGCVVLAEHVKEFSVDLTQVEEKRVVQIAMTFTNGNKEYKTSNNITIRNKVGINDVTIAPLDRKVELSVIPREISVILEPGETYHFSTPKVTGKNVTDKSVVWSVEGSGVGDPPAGGTTPDGSGFTDVNNGILQIAAKETAASFNVVITTNAKDSDGNHATATVIVNVKRAHNVVLSKKNVSSEITNGSLELTAGQDFVIDAGVEGICLGIACDGCHADVTKDKDVVTDDFLYGWQVTEGADLITVKDKAEKNATFTLSNTAKKGDTITIKATSYHSVQSRNGSIYGPVQGTITLTVTKQNEIDWPPLPENLQYGYGDPVYNQITGGLRQEDQYKPFIICVRVKESLEANKADDKVLLYKALGGSDISLFPDLFDLDLQKKYYFLVQVLESVSGETKDDIIKDYTDTKNQDEYGKYIGDKRKATKQYMTVMDGTALAFNYKEKTYLDENITYDTYYVNDQNIMQISPNYEASHNIFKESLISSLTYSIYMGNGTDMSGWKKLYYLDPDTLSYVNADGTDKKIRGGSILVNLTKKPGEIPDTPIYNIGNPFLQYDINCTDITKISGTYHVVPGVVYRNGYRDGNLYYMTSRYEIIYEQNVESDYSKFKARYYEFPNSTMHLTIKLSNLHMESDKFTGDFYFPYPSATLSWGGSAFPFERGVTDTQHKAWYGFYGYPSTGGGKQRIEFEDITCTYIAKKDLYEIKFLYTEWVSGVQVTRSSGTYQCASDGTEWEMVDPAH